VALLFLLYSMFSNICTGNSRSFLLFPMQMYENKKQKKDVTIIYSLVISENRKYFFQTK